MDMRLVAGFIILMSILAAGCIQLPGMHVVTDSPAPVIGQWIGGEPPASDLHLIFFENHTFVSIRYFLNRGEETRTGIWTMVKPGAYRIQISGTIDNWTYDPTLDSVYMNAMPQQKYERYRG